MMDQSSRAKQFAPFSPLRGMNEAMLAQEQTREARIFLGEDAQAELNRKLLSLEAGDIITAEFYRGGHYIRVRGSVEKIDINARRLILGDVRIPLDDLKDIYRED